MMWYHKWVQRVIIIVGHAPHRHLYTLSNSSLLGMASAFLLLIQHDFVIETLLSKPACCWSSGRDLTLNLPIIQASRDDGELILFHIFPPQVGMGVK